MLERLGYHVVAAADGREAVQLFKASPEQFDLIILDIVMPGLSGPSAFSQMVEVRSDLRVVFSSGYTAEVVALNSLLRQGASILQKPYSLKNLGQAIRTALDAPRPRFASQTTSKV